MKRRREDDDLKPTKVSSSKAEDASYRRKLYAVSVRDTLRKKSEGDVAEYQNLVRRFTTATALKDVASMEELHLLLNALSHLVSHLDRKQAVLVNAIISLQWASAEESFVKSYTSFIGLLLSAQSQYGVDVLEKAVDGLSFQPDVSALNIESSKGPSGKRLTRRDLYERHHALLHHVLSIVPTLTKALQPIVTRKFPHKRLEKIYHVTYVRNILRLAEYSPGLSDHVIGLVVERTIQIDVEIQGELDELEDASQVYEAVFDLDDDPFDSEVSAQPKPHLGSDDGNDDLFSDLSSESELDLDEDDGKVKKSESTDPVHIRELVAKLDAVLKLLFDHLISSHSPRPSPPSFEIKPSSSLPPSPSRNPKSEITNPSTPPLPPFTEDELYDIQSVQFQTLLHSFERTVLQTFKSRYTQFVIFWFTSLHPDFTDAFLGLLVGKSTNSSSASDPSNLLSSTSLTRDTPLTRAASASYLASFVSRARFVDGASVRRVVTLLCAYLAKDLEVYYTEVKVPVHISLYTPFYAVAQAVFLIFCFRWRDLRIGDQEKEGKEEGENKEPKKEEEDTEDNDDLGLNADAKLGDRTRWIPELDVIQQIIVSPLNPLKFCSENVVEQFASIASKTTFAFCYSIIEQNKRSTFSGAAPAIILPPSSIPSSHKSSLKTLLPKSVSKVHSYTIISSPSRMTGTPSASLTRQPQASSLSVPRSVFSTGTSKSVATSQEAANHVADLNSFFPFDPYHLPLSRVYIDGVYREWAEVRIDDGDETDDDEGDSTSEGESVKDEDSDEESDPNEKRKGPQIVGSVQGMPMPISMRPMGLSPPVDDSDDALGLGDSFGGMSISPVRRMGTSQSLMALAAGV